jgi:hypothetical protein
MLSRQAAHLPRAAAALRQTAITPTTLFKKIRLSVVLDRGDEGVLNLSHYW